MALTLWGYTDAIDLDSGASSTNIIAGVGTFGAISDAYVAEFGFYNPNGTSRSVRMALYSGGASATDPVGATLITELAFAGAGTGWVTGTVTGAPAIPASTRIWVMCKTSGGLSYQSSFGSYGNYNGTAGRVTVIGATNTNDHTAAFPATMDNTSTTTNNWGVHLRMGYDISAGATNRRGALIRRSIIRNYY
jgi:hypothetical protein